MKKILLLLLFTTSALFSVKAENPRFKALKNMEIFNNVIRELSLFYVDTLDYDILVKAAIDAMLNKIDPYTNYIDKDRSDDFNMMIKGEYGGIGALIRKMDTVCYVAEVYDGFPAANAGLVSGDILLKIDTMKNLNAIPVEKISDFLRGEKNTPLQLVVQRVKTGKIDTLQLVREVVHLSAVSFMDMLDSITGYINFSSFTENSSEEFKKAFIELKSRGMKKLMIDLRDNGGGSIEEAVKMVNFFIPRKRLVVSVKGKNKFTSSDYYTTNLPLDTEIPLVVLINKNSASASEIVAGALQDYDRATLVGEKTFGKGLVQVVRAMVYNTQIKLTNAKYYIPSGRCIQAIDYSVTENKNISDKDKTVYYTAKKREVYSRGGIEPDFHFTDTVTSLLAIELYVDGLFFHYANQYYKKHDSISSPVHFFIDSTEYQKFVSYVTSTDFKYIFKSNQELEKLKKTLMQEERYELGQQAFTMLEEAIKPNPKKDMEIYKEEISQLLAEDVILRYYGRKGQMEKRLFTDKSVAFGKTKF